MRSSRHSIPSLHNRLASTADRRSASRQRPSRIIVRIASGGAQPSRNSSLRTPLCRDADPALSPSMGARQRLLGKQIPGDCREDVIEEPCLRCVAVVRER